MIGHTAPRETPTVTARAIARWTIPLLIGLLPVTGPFGRGSALLSQRRFGPGVCGPVDPVYLKSATETGGQPFFLSPDEVSKSAHIMRASSQDELLLWASAQGERTYEVPVDGSVERATFSVSFDGTGGTLAVVSPQGVDVQQDAHSEDTRLNCGRVTTIEAPATGTWQLRVSPSARFWLVARAKSEVSLISAEFVQPGGRPGHEGLFKIQGEPIAGRPAMLQVNLSSAAKSPTFELVSVDARALQTLHLKSMGDEEFVGPVTLPTEPFRVVASGFDESGARFQRIFAALFHATLIEVIPPTLESVVAGITTPVTFKVRNLGPAVRLTLTASDGRGKVVTVEPPAVLLESGTETAAIVRLTVPADAASESEVSVLLTASGDGASSAMNYARKAFTVTRR
jgi:hypothetical protein